MSFFGTFYWWVGRSFGLLRGDSAPPVNRVDSAAGQVITPDSALQISAAYACVRLLSQTVATLPLMLMRRDDNGNRSVARELDLYRILHDQPNADMTAVEFWECMVAGLCLWGNGYAKKLRSGRRIIGLMPLRPDVMTVYRTERGELRYRYDKPGAAQNDFGADEILHVKGFTVDGLVGLSPIGYARNSLGLASALDNAAGGTFKNGLRSVGVFKFPTWLKQDQREQFRTYMESFAGTGDNVGKSLVLEGGVDFMPTMLNPNDAELLASRKFSVEDVCRWYGVPPFMIGHTEKSTSWGTGLEQQNIGFLTYGLRPILSHIEQAVKKALLQPEERGRLYAEFNLEGLLRADSAGRAQLYSQMVQNGIYTRNEVRHKENLEPMPGGDELTAQSNLLPLDKLGATQPAPVAKDHGQSIIYMASSLAAMPPVTHKNP